MGKCERRSIRSHKAAGELASQKVMAEGVSIHAILPEQMQEEDVKHLTDTVGELCKK